MDGAGSKDSVGHLENNHAANQTIQQQEAIYACSICFQTAIHPVTSICGHLFCRECLFTWLHGQPGPCPMCRTNLIQGVNIIPIFTNTSVNESLGEPLSNTNATTPQRPRPPSPSDILGPIPLASPVRMVLNTMENRMDDETTDILQETIYDPTLNPLGQTVENLVEWNFRLGQENHQLIDLVNGHHAREIDGIHHQYAQEIDRINRMQRTHVQEFEAMASLRQLRNESDLMHGYHAQEIEGIHHQYAQEIDWIIRMQQTHVQEFEAMASLRQLRNEIDLMNGHHAQEIEGIHHQYAQEIDRMQQAHVQEFEAMASLRQLHNVIDMMH